MKTLFVSYRVTDLDRSLGFYTALGYAELGRVEVGDGARLVILKSGHPHIRQESPKTRIGYSRATNLRSLVTATDQRANLRRRLTN